MRSGIAEELLAETRRLGNPPDGHAAELLSFVGNVLAERGFAAMALDLLAEGDAEWVRYDGDQKLLWLARNAQFRAIALNALGRQAESIETSKLALRTYRRAMLEVDDHNVGPEAALDLIAQIAAAARTADAESEEVLGTITVLLVRMCDTIARSYLATGRVLMALPWLDVTARAIDCVDAAQRPLVKCLAAGAYFALTLGVMMAVDAGIAGWTEESVPSEVVSALDRFATLTEQDLDLSQLPGAQSFDSRSLVVQSQLRTGHVDKARAELETMLTDFGGDDMKRATVLATLASIDLSMSKCDLDASESRAREALRIAEARLEDGKYLLSNCQESWPRSPSVAAHSRRRSDGRRWPSSPSCESPLTECSTRRRYN